MNFCYIFTIFCGIFLLAVIFVNSIEAYATRRPNDKTAQQLNAFRPEAFKTEKDLKRLTKSLRENSENGKRQRRQTRDTSKFVLDVGNANPLTDFSKDDNIGGVWKPHRFQISLMPSKELNGIKMNRDRSIGESALTIGGQEIESNANDETNSGNMIDKRSNVQAKENSEYLNEINKSIYGGIKRQFRAKDQSYKNFKNHDLNTQMLKSFLNKNSLRNSQQISSCLNSDLSSCQHCSEHEQAENINNKANNKNRLAEKHDDGDSKYLTKTKHVKKLDVFEPSHQTFGQKYNTENQNDEEDDDDEDDGLYTLKYPSIISTGNNKPETENVKSSQKSFPNLGNNSANEKLKTSLNDQLENTKNNLSHEANYKLSKVEQDAAEKKKNFSWKWGIIKRSYQFNPMNEIRLKTSSRLMKKGFGASLPSYSLGETRKELLIENMLRKKEMQMLQPKTRKYDVSNLETFNEPFDDNIGENNKHSEEFVATNLKPVLEELPQNEWNYKRRHSISDAREIKQNEMTGLLYSGNVNNQAEELKRTENSKVTNYPTLQRRKRSMPMEKLTKHSLSSKTSNTSLNKPQNQGNVLVTSNNPKETLIIPKALNILRRVKHYNPKKNLQLKIYKKLHPKQALSFNKLNQQATKKLMNFPKKTRNKRSLKNNSIIANSSTEKHNFITILTKKLYKKARNFKKHLKAFLKKSLKYLTFQNTSNRILNKSQMAVNASLVNENYKLIANKTTDEKALNNSEAYKKADVKNINKPLLNESFEANATKITYKININPKLKFLKEKLYNLFHYNHSFQSFNGKSRSQRSVLNTKQFVGATEKYMKKSCSKDLMNSEEEQFSSTSFKRSFKTQNKTNISNNCSPTHEANTSTNITEKSNTSDAKLVDFIKIKNYTNKSFVEKQFEDSKTLSLHKASTFDLQHDDSKQIANHTNKGIVVEKLKDRFKFSKHLNQTLSSIKSFVTKKRQKRAFATDFIITLKPFELNKHDLFNRLHKFAKPLKRSKRSLDSRKSESRQKFDTTKQFNKNRYFPQLDNLYKPQNNMNIWDAKQSDTNLENEFIKPSDYDYEQIQKSFNNEHFKNTLQNFENTKLENLQNNFLKSKRFLKPTKTKPGKTPINYFKRNNFANLLNDININETTQKEVTATDFPLKVQLMKDEYLKDLQNFNKNYKFNENHFNWPTPKLKSYTDIKDNSTDDSQKLGLELRNEILNCKAFASLEQFLKSLPKNITNALLNGHTELPSNLQSTEKIEMAISTPIITEVTSSSESPTVLDSTIICSTASESNPIEEIETNTECTETEDVSEQDEINLKQSTESGSMVTTDFIVEAEGTTSCLPSNILAEDENVKLNITINANVHGNAKTHEFCGNGSFNFMPGLEDDRRRREIFHSPLANFQKRKFAEITTQKPYDTEDNEDFNDLMSGKLSSNLVKTILNTVRETPNLKELWPSLQYNQPIENTAAPNFYAIRNQQNKNQLQDSEKLLAQLMASINNIIEEQARTHACVPLRADLQEFYNMIIQSRREQDRVREKRQLYKTSRKKDFSYKIHLLHPNRIDEETKIVQKLLKQYEELSPEDQSQMLAVKDDLLKNLLILKQLQDNEEEKHENVLRKRREHTCAVNDVENLKDQQIQYSAQFLKLLKAAEFYKAITSK